MAQPLRYHPIRDHPAQDVVESAIRSSRYIVIVLVTGNAIDGLRGMTAADELGPAAQPGATGRGG